MATNLVPVEWRLHAARQFIESITERANTAWYIWYGDHVTDGSPGNVYDMVLDTTVNVYRNMIMGKRITESNVLPVVRYIPWVSGTVYTMYDHGDPLMFDKDFFVCIEAGSYTHVFKCLDNNRGAPSTASPDFADVDATDAIYQTSDGYRWRYMYTVDLETTRRYATSSYFPVVANTSVESAAVSGSIDVVRIYDVGEGYNNYLTGTFDGAHVRVNGNNLVYSVSSNTQASMVEGFYTGCMLYISAGNGVGQFRAVNHYFSNSSGKFVRLSTAFDVSPTNGSEWDLYPSIRIVSGGSETVNAIGRALVNAVGNSIHRVEMLERGAEYTYATATVVANAVVGVVRAANVVPVYSPSRGHGSDAAAELGCTRVAVSVKLSNNEANTIPATNSFRQVGVLRDPIWANVALTVAPVGAFYVGEGLKKYTDVCLVNDATAIESTVFFSSNSGMWDSRIQIGDELIIKTDLRHQLVSVVNVPNTTHVEVNSAMQFSCTETTVCLATIDLSEASVLSQPTTNTLLVEITNGTIGANDDLIGMLSGATASVSAVGRNGVAKGFGTFVQCWKYMGTYVSGTFDEDEFVYQGDSFSEASSTAQLHSAVDDGGTVTVLTTNQIGSFETSQQLKGANSGAILTISTKYSPEIKYGSGRVTFIQNIDPVARAGDRAETFRMILDF